MTTLGKEQPTPGFRAFAEYYSRQAGAAVSMPDSWNMQSDATRADWEAAAQETAPERRFDCCCHCQHDPGYEPDRHTIPCPDGCNNPVA